ncbi:unnamed protein product [Anisakis simplex]|uniref:Uncharacterized protein n=1 Tax=Anisakis simplex TaxID=6269 RepID=A0A0M3KBL6_ANISI|nr:unnamed protein product [Anisakis simplex]
MERCEVELGRCELRAGLDAGRLGGRYLPGLLVLWNVEEEVVQDNRRVEFRAGVGVGLEVGFRVVGILVGICSESVDSNNDNDSKMRSVRFIAERIITNT